MTDDAPIWEELKAILRLAAQIFGEPAHLLDDMAMASRDARRLRAWLAALEAVARALLVLMAARLPRPFPARARRARQPAGAKAVKARTHQPRDELAAEPPGSELWAGVTFRIAIGLSSGVRRPKGPPRRFTHTRALACRFEALIRVAENPAPFARRLARRLYAEPTLAARALRPQRRGSERPPPFDDLVDEALSRARAAVPVFTPGTG